MSPAEESREMTELLDWNGGDEEAAARACTYMRRIITNVEMSKLKTMEENGGGVLKRGQ